MLVRRGVEDRVRSELADNGVNAWPVANIGDDRRERHGGEAVLEFVEDLEDRILAVTEQYEMRGPQLRQLPTEFRPDRPAGAGDEHELAVCQ